MRPIKVLVAFGLLAGLAACSGRSEPEGSFLDPVCMPDGSVSFYQKTNASGQYDKPIATKANCPWNKPKAATAK